MTAWSKEIKLDFKDEAEKKLFEWAESSILVKAAKKLNIYLCALRGITTPGYR